MHEQLKVRLGSVGGILALVNKPLAISAYRLLRRRGHVTSILVSVNMPVQSVHKSIPFLKQHLDFDGLELYALFSKGI
jgi:hypothetical protein